MIMAAGGSATALLLVCAHRPPPVVLRAAKRNATVHGAGTAASLCNELSKVLKGKVSFKSTPFVIISRSLHSPLYVGISLLPHWALLCYVMLIRTTITCNKRDCPLTSVYPEQKSDFAAVSCLPLAVNPPSCLCTALMTKYCINLCSTWVNFYQFLEHLW